MKYGLLIASTSNLGDDIQSLAALQFYPRVDYFINRDYIDKAANIDDEVKIVMNGWFTHRPWAWPPPSNIIPLIISFHLYPYAAPILLNSKNIEYFRKHEPIGARDKVTMKLLRSENVKSYFSGCLTLTFDYKLFSGKPQEKEKYILLVDIPQELANFIRKKSSKDILIKTQELNKLDISFVDKILVKILRLFPSFVKKILHSNKYVYLEFNKKYYGYKYLSTYYKQFNYIIRLFLALERLNEIYNSDCIITSRLHVALPAIGLNKKTILLVKSKNLALRTSGLRDFIKHYTHKSIINAVLDRSVEKLCETAQPNNIDELQYLKKSLINITEKYMKRSAVIF